MRTAAGEERARQQSNSTSHLPALNAVLDFMIEVVELTNGDEHKELPAQASAPADSTRRLQL
jgi:hypothetical protein